MSAPAHAVNDGQRAARSLLALFVACLGGCARPSTVVEVDFQPDALAASAVAVEVFVVGACAAIAPGTVPTGASQRVIFRRGEVAMPLGATPAGAFGVYALARADDCSVVAAGCIDTARGAERIVVPVTALDGAACTRPDACDRGVCDGEGTTTLDAGADASDLDAGVDASLVCAPACEPGLTCTISGCSPETVGLARHGEAGDVAATRAIDDGDGAVYALGRFGGSVMFSRLLANPDTEVPDGFVVRVNGEEGGVGPEWATRVQLDSNAPRNPSLTDLVLHRGRLWVTGYSGDANGSVAFESAMGTERANAPLGGVPGIYLGELDRSNGHLLRFAYVPTHVAPERLASNGVDLFVAGIGYVGLSALDASLGDDEPRTTSWIASFAQTGDAAPTARWARRMLGDGDAGPSALVATSSRVCSGGFYTAGPAELDFPPNTNGVFIECLDTAGARVSRQLAPSHLASVLALATNGSELFAGGELTEPLSFAGETGPVELFPTTSQTSWIGGFDLESGACLWLRAFGGTGRVRLTSIDVGDHGDLYVSATFARDVRFPPDALAWTEPEGGHAILRLHPPARGAAATASLVWGRHVVTTDTLVGTDRIVGHGLRVAQLTTPRAETVYVGWAPGTLQFGTLGAERSWNPFFLARLREIE